MTIERQVVNIGTYNGRSIRITLMGPDFLAYVGEVELSGFFISPQAGISAAQKYIDDERRAKEKKQ